MKHFSFIIYVLLASLLLNSCKTNVQKGEITPELTASLQKYDEWYLFHNGLAKVEKDGKYGYIDYQGNEVIPCIYDKAHDFENSCAVVNKQGKYGCIDVNGNEVIPFEYESICILNDSYCIVKKGGLFGYIDLEGNEITPCRYTSAAPFYEDLAQVKKESSYAYINKKGKEVFACKYDYADNFSDGLALVKKDELYGFIDKTGKEVIPCKYSFAQSFSEGLAAIEMADTEGISNCGYIDTKGNVVIPCIYNTSNGINPFTNGVAVVMDDSGFLGCIDKRGKEIHPFVYAEIEIYDGVIIARESFSESYRLFDNKCNEISESSFDAIYPSGNDLISIVNKGKSGFINKAGKEVIPCMFDSYFDEGTDTWISGCSPFVEGLSIVKLNGKYGAIDSLGNEVIPYIYDEISDFSEGLAVAKIADKWGYIDSKGNSTFSQVEITAAKQRMGSGNFDKKQKVASNEIKESKSNPKDIVITMNAHCNTMGEMSNMSGSYGVFQKQYDILRTNPITIPKGKVWIFKQYKNNSTVRIYTSKSFITALDNGYIPEGSKRHYLENMNEAFTFIGGTEIQAYIEVIPTREGDIAIEFNFVEKDAEDYY